MKSKAGQADRSASLRAKITLWLIQHVNFQCLIQFFIYFLACLTIAALAGDGEGAPCCTRAKAGSPRCLAQGYLSSEGTSPATRAPPNFCPAGLEPAALLLRPDLMFTLNVGSAYRLLRQQRSGIRAALGHLFRCI